MYAWRVKKVKSDNKPNFIFDMYFRLLCTLIYTINLETKNIVLRLKALPYVANKKWISFYNLQTIGLE